MNVHATSSRQKSCQLILAYEGHNNTIILVFTGRKINKMIASSRTWSTYHVAWDHGQYIRGTNNHTWQLYIITHPLYTSTGAWELPLTKLWCTENSWTNASCTAYRNNLQHETKEAHIIYSPVNKRGLDTMISLCAFTKVHNRTISIIVTIMMMLCRRSGISKGWPNLW